MKNMSPIERAVKAVGSQTLLAKVLGCTPQNVQQMCATGKVPGKHVLRIEAASGVPRSELNPDLYPVELPTLNANLRQIRSIHQTVDHAADPYSEIPVAS